MARDERSSARPEHEVQVSTYSWLKLVHILSAIVAVGTNATYFFWLTRAKKDPEHDLYMLRGIKALDMKLANPAYVVLPITGVLMVLDGDIGFTTFWIALAIGLYIFMGAFAGIFFWPALRRQTEVAGAEGAGSPPTSRPPGVRRSQARSPCSPLPASSISWS